MTFEDRFSTQATEYAAFRPSYPDGFVAHLAGLAPSRALAWDCATGNGQAAVQLAAHFDRVIASDASPAQIARAAQHARIDYRVSREDDSGAAPAAVDLVTVAQALHWLDLSRFYTEVRRVLRPGGLIAVWSYGPVRIEPRVDEILAWFEDTRLRRFRAAELDHVHSGYRNIDFPFDEVPAGSWKIEAPLTRPQFLGFVSSWSAVAAERRTLGSDPLADLEAALTPVWPADGSPRTVCLPIGLRVGR